METNKDIQALSASLGDYLQREMPAGTVIGDPAWWADRIARAILATRQPAPVASAPAVAIRWPDGRGRYHYADVSDTVTKEALQQAEYLTLAAPQPAAAPVAADVVRGDAIYQVQHTACPDWSDVTEAIYNNWFPANRRIVYSQPQADAARGLEN